MQRSLEPRPGRRHRLRRTAAAAAAPLLLAMLLQSVAPHPHEWGFEAPAIGAASSSPAPASALLDAGGCVACRLCAASFGIAASGASLPVRDGEPAQRLARESDRTLLSSVERDDAPPRAPPLHLL